MNVFFTYVKSSLSPMLSPRLLHSREFYV